MKSKNHNKLNGSQSTLFDHGVMNRGDKVEGQEVIRLIVMLKANNKSKIKVDRTLSKEKRQQIFEKKYAPPDDVLMKVVDFTEKYQLSIDKLIKGIGVVYLSGTIENIEKAFKVEMHKHEYKDEIKRYKQTVIGHEGKHSIPKELMNIISGIIGLTHVPLMHQVPVNDFPNTKSFSAANGLPSNWYADHYHFPKKGNGAGQVIGVISCGGGITQSDMNHYYEELGEKVNNEIQFISVGDSENLPGKNFSYDFELATDCQVCLGAAPAAILKVYSTSNSLKGLADALIKINEESSDQPSIVSYSWGASESHYSINEVNAIERILQYTTIVNDITIICAAGDKGSTNDYVSQPDSPLEVQYPASSQWVLSCGGTMITIDEKGNVIDETVWNSKYNLYDILISNATGGGFSKYIEIPPYQKGCLKKNNENYPSHFRGVPDVSAHADMSPCGIAYWVYVDGQNWLSGGTSAVAPLMAALIARLNQILDRRLGFINELLYDMADSVVLNPIQTGNNMMKNGPKFWEAKGQWNPCVGLGTPDGERMLGYLKKTLRNNS